MVHNVCFYKNGNKESMEVVKQLNSLPFKVVKICIDKINPVKIPRFVTAVPLIRMENGEIFAGDKLRSWCSTFCRSSASSNVCKENRNKPNMEITGDPSISPICGNELSGFSDGYSLLTDSLNEKKVEQINPLDHSYSFLGRKDDPITTTSSSNNNDPNKLGNAYEKMMMERNRELKPPPKM